MYNDYETMPLGPAPTGEDCVQVSKTDDYAQAMRAEVARYKELLEKRFPVPASLEGKVSFIRQSNRHDFGAYYEIEVKYAIDDPEDEAPVNFALFVESNLPETWDDPAVLIFEEEGVQHA